MTKEEFVKNNRGINDSEDLPLDYLNKIYDDIASTKIDLKNTSSTTIFFTKNSIYYKKPFISRTIYVISSW